MPDVVIFASYGNDSIALIQHFAEAEERNVTVAYSDTGWADPAWVKRVEAGEVFARAQGFDTVRIPSMGFVPLARMRKAFPRNGMQFCTTHLKILPAAAWLDSVDPGCETICAVGVRRAESKARASWPEWTESSDKHGGRSLWAPLVRHSDEERDALILRAGFPILPHRSMECYPCVNANKADLRMLTEERVTEIEEIEASMGVTAKGSPRTLFRPTTKGGAVGIRECVKWGHSAHGAYEPPSSGCDSGMCAM